MSLIAWYTFLYAMVLLSLIINLIIGKLFITQLLSVNSVTLLSEIS